MTASPTNFSTVPPYRSISRFRNSWYGRRRARTSSGSARSDAAVCPTRSTKRTETSLRSSDSTGPASAAAIRTSRRTETPRDSPGRTLRRRSCHGCSHSVGSPELRTQRRNVGPRIRRAGSAFVHHTGQLSACAYSRPAWFRPTRAPCSAQSALYACVHEPSRGRRGILRKLRHFVENPLSPAPTPQGAGGSSPPEPPPTVTASQYLREIPRRQDACSVSTGSVFRKRNRIHDFQT